jgi:hypothetical protein
MSGRALSRKAALDQRTVGGGGRGRGWVGDRREAWNLAETCKQRAGNGSTQNAHAHLPAQVQHHRLLDHAEVCLVLLYWYCVR